MGFLDRFSPRSSQNPRWLDSLPEHLRPNSDQIAHLEALRKKGEVSHAEFSHAIASHPSTTRKVQSHLMRELRTIDPSATEHQRLVGLIASRWEARRRIGKDLLGLTAYAQEGHDAVARRLDELASQAQSLDRLADLFILADFEDYVEGDPQYVWIGHELDRVLGERDPGRKDVILAEDLAEAFGLENWRSQAGLECFAELVGYLDPDIEIIEQRTSAVEWDVFQFSLITTTVNARSWEDRFTRALLDLIYREWAIPERDIEQWDVYVASRLDEYSRHLGLTPPELVRVLPTMLSRVIRGASGLVYQAVEADVLEIMANLARRLHELEKDYRVE